MDSRKVSSLSVKSDGSDSSVNRGHNLILEKIGELSANEAGAPKSLTSSGSFICMLGGQTHVYILEVKLRVDAELTVPRRGLLQLPGIKEDKHYHDATIFQINAGEYRLALLGERKNKERFISVVEVDVSGKGVVLGEELCSYDKASMLGKGLSHVAALSAGQNGETDVLVFSNIVRKLKIEDRGTVIKPTSARVPIPPDCMDGTIAVCVSDSKKGFSLITSFRTKSAGKNKYQINWYQCRKDELSAPSGKSAIKLPEDQEPSVILSDPRDSRSAYVITNNGNEGSLCKLVRGKKLDEPITTFPFSVQEATFVSAPDKSLFLLVLNNNNLEIVIFHMTKTEGYRGLTATWTGVPHQESSPLYHAISCSQSKWQFQAKLAEYLVSSRCSYQVGLATLLLNRDIATEPESAAPYRIRLVGGDQMNDILMILLDDIERTFESEEESLATMNLKVCMNSSPGREGMSQVSAWLMAGRLSSVEIFSTRLDADSPTGGGDRLVVHSLTPDLFRSYVVEQDWTQSTKKEGTFVLEPSTTDAGGISPASIRTSTPSRPSSNRSRIPSASNRRSMHLDGGLSNGSMTTSLNCGRPELGSVILQVEDSLAPLARANAQIRETLESLERHVVALKSASGADSLTESDYLEA